MMKKMKIPDLKEKIEEIHTFQIKIKNKNL